MTAAGVPYAAPAAGPLPPNVIPFSRPARAPGVRSIQISRHDGQDKYAEFLAGLPDLSPNPLVPPAFFGVLVPDERELADLPEMAPPHCVHENSEAHEDPRQDAYGGRAMVRHAVSDLAKAPAGGEGGGEPPAA